MAVVYADLRFARTPAQEPPHTDLSQIYGEWGVTYENVTPLREHGEGRKDSHTPVLRRWLNRFLALHSPYVTACLLPICLVLLGATIRLSVRLSQVSHLHEETASQLEKLQEEHRDLNATLLGTIVWKEHELEVKEEILKQTRAELEQTQYLLGNSRGSNTETNQRLDTAIKQKNKFQSDFNVCQVDLQRKAAELDQNSRQLTSCQWSLDSCAQEKININNNYRRLQNFLSDKTKKLEAAQKTLSDTQRELLTVRNVLRETERNLEETRESDAQRGKNLSALQQRWSEVQQCVSCENHKNGESGAYDDPFDYCPDVWEQIGDQCYYFSSESQYRLQSETACRSSGAVLAKLEESDDILKKMIAKSSRSYWIGLKKVEHQGQTNLFRWSDNSSQTLESLPNQFCAKATPELKAETCSKLLPWICQKKTERCHGQRELLQCFGEKLGVFGKRNLPELRTEQNPNTTPGANTEIA
ncbi:hypothetical protein XENTR_v10003255 [Xenopus tropicalis]|uniref:C-type lectin domain family 4 member F-like n=1 Tax=Xenopus tropicalis TaxID=8364 RepID=A0A8J1IZ45_XENTR|nr:C-type lectin domain family 4 member F-like [Xenopus tropicalis]KAE8636993.1 hypothetical protein XENTR_v10003255 [Xenopus tropicalis]KAE8636994.1 hypothetical protein XENTR_v10003255 [Xenopus tropicalis]